MKIKTILIKIFNLTVFILITIALSIIIKVFVFASFKIPTHSMDPTIIAGDYILVNKLLLGPRIYENLSFLKYTKTKMKRIWKWHNVKRNDILVFDFPYKWYAPNKIIQGGNLFYVKRCIAIPGDTFCIDNGVYKVKDINGNLGNIEKHSNLSQIESNSLIFNKRFRDIFPKDTTYFRWTIKNFGPLYIPAKDDNLSFDSISIKLYKNLIEYETEKIISIKNGIIYLGDSIINKYTFLQNYYFVAGDFISASEDSRYWGLLPDDLVVGKAVVIWKSQDIITGKYRWNRFLKTIK